MYLGKLYDVIDPNKSAMLIHQSLKQQLAPANSSCNIVTWIERLDKKGILKKANPEAEKYNQKCIYGNDTRINLPSFFNVNSKVNDLLKKIEKEVSIARGHKKAVGADAGGLASGALTADNIVPAIEKELGTDLARAILPYVDNTHVPVAALHRSFMKLNSKADRTVLGPLLKTMVTLACQGEQPGPDGVLVGDLVRLIINTPSKHFDKTRAALVAELAAQIDEPVRETLQQEVVDYEDGISKDDFIGSFQGLDGAIDKWKLTCMFYSFDVDDGQDENVDFETLVKIVMEAKGLKYVPPGNGKAPPGKQSAKGAASLNQKPKAQPIKTSPR